MTDANEMFKQAGEAIASSSPQVQEVIKLADESVELEATISSLEELLKSANARYNEIKTKLLPDAMASMGSSEWTAANKKVKIKIEDFVAGTLPKADDPEDPLARQKAIDLIESYGGYDLIKTEVELSFGKSEHNAALNAIGALRELGLEPSVRSGIHPQSLLAFVRERLKNGDPVDVKALGLFQGRKAKITIKKEA